MECKSSSPDVSAREYLKKLDGRVPDVKSDSFRFCK